jgi:hypothetical protein
VLVCRCRRRCLIVEALVIGPVDRGGCRGCVGAGGETSLLKHLGLALWIEEVAEYVLVCRCRERKLIVEAFEIGPVVRAGCRVCAGV